MHEDTQDRHRHEKIDIDRFTELKDVLSRAPSDTIMLPSADDLFAYLTCSAGGRGWKCREFVCYKHNEHLVPLRGETTQQIPDTGNKWSRPIPKRVIQQFEDRLKVTV